MGGGRGARSAENRATLCKIQKRINATSMGGHPLKGQLRETLFSGPSLYLHRMTRVKFKDFDCGLNIDRYRLYAVYLRFQPK
jgi:hypothetical protein